MEIFINDKLYKDGIKQVHISMYWNDMKESSKSSSSSFSFTMNCMKYIIKRGANNKTIVQNNKQTNKQKKFTE